MHVLGLSVRLCYLLGCSVRLLTLMNTSRYECTIRQGGERHRVALIERISRMCRSRPSKRFTFRCLFSCLCTTVLRLFSLFAVEEDEVPELKEPDLPIVASYLSSTPYTYGKPDSDSLALEPCITHNGVVDHGRHGNRSPSPAPSPTLPREPSPLGDGRSQREGSRAPVSEQNGLPPGPHCAMNGALSMDLAEPRPQVANTAVARQQPIPQQFNCTQAGGSVPAFQPFFFTSTFPVNVQGKHVVGAHPKTH